MVWGSGISHCSIEPFCANGVGVLPRRRGLFGGKSLAENMGRRKEGGAPVR